MTSGLMSFLTVMLVGQIIIVDGQKPRKQIKESPRKESGEDAGRRWKMKITLDIPDTTVCAYFCYVNYDSQGASMGCTLLDTDDFVNGNEIKIPKGKKEVEDGN